MVESHALFVEADRLRREEGVASYRYLSVLLQIQSRKVLWGKKYGTFKEFLDDTGHGPYDRFSRFQEIHQVCEKHDFNRVSQGERRRGGSLEIIGFEPAAQVLNIEMPQRSRVIEALRSEAISQGKPLTYQAAVTTIASLLKLPRTPSKTLRGEALRAMRAELRRLREEKTTLMQIVVVLRKRLRDNGLSDTTRYDPASQPSAH